MAYKALDILTQDAYIKRAPSYRADLAVACIHSHAFLL